ncbi:MAG: YrdB family protein [Kineosporiaceae bacterium]
MLGAVETVAKGANATLAFGLELAVLGSVGYWGWKTGKTRPVKVALAVGAPVVWATVWGLVGAPDAAVSLNTPARLAFEAVWFGAGAAALAATGHRKAAAALAGAWVINATLATMWDQN